MKGYWMADTILHNVEPVKREELQTGTWLMLLYADKIPPHLALLADGKYYSLTANEVQIGLDIEPFWRTIQSKSIPSIFVQIESVPNAELLAAEFSAYQTAVPGSITCLNPIRNYLNRLHQLPVYDVEFVFHLVDRLEEYDMLLASRHVHLRDKLSGGSYQLMKYTVEEIFERIAQLQKTSADV